MVANKTNIHISANPSRVDEAVEIHISGAPTNTWITIQTVMRDNLGSDWESFAEVLTDDSGYCDLSAQTPRTGTYACQDAMGLIWSMQWKSNDPALRTPLAPIHTKLRVLAKGETLTEAIWIRYPLSPNVTRIPVRENGLVGALYVPKEGGPYPAIVMLGGSEGGLRSSNASLLSAHGFAVLALAYFGIGELHEQLMHIPLEYFYKAIEWLQKRDDVASEKLAFIGTSRGGELALLCGSFFPEIKAVVGIVPSSVVVRGIGAAPEDQIPYAWTWRGKGLPYLNTLPPSDIREEIVRQRKAGEQVRLRDSFLSQLQLADEETIEKVAIPVHNIQGNVLIISGGDDQMWPSTVYGERIIRHLERYNHPHEYLHLNYPHAGHMIHAPFYPTTKRDGNYLLGGSPQADAQAQAKAWHEIIQFLNRSLL